MCTTTSIRFRFLVLSVIFLLTASRTFAVDYTSRANGNWGTTTTWTPNGTPGSADNVTINHAVIVAANASVHNLTVNSGSLTLNGNLTVYGDVTINSGAVVDLMTYLCNRSAAGGTFALGNAGYLRVGSNTGGLNASNFPNLFATYSLAATSRVEFYRAGAQDVPFVMVSGTTYAGIDYGKLIISGSGTKTAREPLTVPNASFPDSAFVVNDSLIVRSGNTFDIGATPLYDKFYGNVLIESTATLTAASGGGAYTRVWFYGPTLTNNGTYTPATGTSGTFYSETRFLNTTVTGNAQTLANTGIDGYTNLNVNITLNSGCLFWITSGGTLNPASTAIITFNTTTFNVIGTTRVTRSNSNMAGQYTGTATSTYTAGTVEFAGTSETVDNFAWGNLFMSGTVALNTSITTTPVGYLKVQGNPVNANPHAKFNLSTFTINGGSTGANILSIGNSDTLVVGGTSGGVAGSNFPTGWTIGTIDANSHIIYGGTALQTVANTVTYGYLDINNATGVNLADGNVTSSILNLVSGNMTTGAADTITVTNNVTGTGGSVIGSVRHRHTFVTSTPYYFEGPNTFINFSAIGSQPTDITITSHPNTLIPEGNSAYAIRRYYTITQNGGSGVTSTLRLHYDTAERNGLTESLFTLWRYNGTAWEDKLFSSRVTGSANSYVEQTGITQFSDWTIAEGAGPLPVQLTSFTASVKKFDVTLEWKTASEKNNYGFDIERQSTDGVWTKIGFVGGHGTTTVPQEYSYTDRNAPPGRLSYRLKQTDFDGAFEYSNIVEVISGATDKSFMLGQNYPSPFNPVTTIEFSIPDDSPTSLKVYNTLGQEVASLVDGEILPAGLIHKVTFNGTNLSSGTYYYILKSGKFSAVKKTILLK